MDQARADLERVFSVMGLTRVVVVDDAFGAPSTAEDVAGSCMRLVDEESNLLRQAVGEFADLDFAVDRDVLRRRFRDTLAGLNEERRKSIAVKLADLAGGRDDNEEESAHQGLRDILRHHELLTLTLSDWRAQRDQMLTEEFAKSTLFLFDLEMPEDGGSADEGMRIIADILSETRSFPVYCGLISHTIDPEYEYSEWESRSDEFELGQGRDRFTVLAKAHLRESPLGFAHRLKRIAISDRCVRMKDAIQTVALDSVNEAASELAKISIYDFEQIVFQSSHAEGVWEPETLLRVFSLYHRQAARSLALQNTQLRDDAKAVRAVVGIRFDPADAPPSSSRAVRELELFEDGEFLNSNHMPLELGDVFELKRRKPSGNLSAKKYMLITQPCDMMVRSTGHRGCEVVTLAEISLKPSDRGFAEFEIPHFSNGASAVVKLASCKTIRADILDLCVLSGDGRATFSCDAEVGGTLIPSWNERRKLLTSLYKEVIHQLEEFQDELSPESTAKDLLVERLLDVNKAVLTGKIDTTAGTVEFGARRTKRIKRPTADAILRCYAQHISRDAFEHDLLREHEE